MNKILLPYKIYLVLHSLWLYCFRPVYALRVDKGRLEFSATTSLGIRRTTPWMTAESILEELNFPRLIRACGLHRRIHRKKTQLCKYNKRKEKEKKRSTIVEI